jgi:hypothetical protein
MHQRRRTDAMTEQPAKLIPDWLATDLVVIVFSLAIVGAWWWLPF